MDSLRVVNYAAAQREEDRKIKRQIVDYLAIQRDEKTKRPKWMSLKIISEVLQLSEVRLAVLLAGLAWGNCIREKYCENSYHYSIRQIDPLSKLCFMAVKSRDLPELDEIHASRLGAEVFNHCKLIWDEKKPEEWKAMTSLSLITVFDVLRNAADVNSLSLDAIACALIFDEKRMLSLFGITSTRKLHVTEENSGHFLSLRLQELATKIQTISFVSPISDYPPKPRSRFWCRIAATENRQRMTKEKYVALLPQGCDLFYWMDRGVSLGYIESGHTPLQIVKTPGPKVSLDIYFKDEDTKPVQPSRDSELIEEEISEEDLAEIGKKILEEEKKQLKLKRQKEAALRKKQQEFEKTKKNTSVSSKPRKKK